MASKSFSGWSKLFQIRSTVPQAMSALSGWHAELAESIPFIEPRLHHASGVPVQEDPRVVLVAAPGAVGKSAFARHLSKQHGLLLVDLAETGPVGANFVSGGIVKLLGARGIELLEAGRLGLVFDALDEARLRVTPEAYEAFLADVAELVQRPACMPIVLLGRTATVETSWIILADAGVEPSILEINFFSRQEAERFVDEYARALDRTNNVGRHELAYKERRNEVLEELRKEVRKAKGSVPFDGYAPVLVSVATALAQLTNFSVPVLAGPSKGNVIDSIPNDILVREQKKIAAALEDRAGELGVDPQSLYAPDEQRLRLLSFLTKNRVSPPNLSSFPSATARDIYERVVQPFLEQHPFLDGQGQCVGNAVFEADLFAVALIDNLGQSRETVIELLRNPSLKPNPFLFPLCMARMGARNGGEPFIAPECVGLLYDSLKARQGAGESTYLRCFAAKNDDGRTGTVVLMALFGEDLEPIFAASLITDATGKITFSRGVGDAVIASDNAIELGDGETIELGAPCVIDARELWLHGAVLQVNAPLGTRLKVAKNSGLDVVLIANSARDERVRRAPRLPQNVSLSVHWEGCGRFPWLGHDLKVAPVPPDIEKARLAFRILILSFRAHSKGALARYEDKIEHQRITKGDVGELIREQLLKDRVLKKKGSFYFLDPDRLGEATGTSYHDIKRRVFSPKCDEYLRKIVAEGNAH